MTVKDLLELGTERLKAAGIESAELDSRVLLKHVLRCDESYLIVHLNDDVVENPQCVLYAQQIKNRAEHMPVAYITCEKEFMGLSFYVDPSVLIPRPDTETLAEEALSLIKGGEEVLDLCCGSGAIGLSLAKLSGAARVDLADISAQALNVAQTNAKLLDVESKVRFFQGSLFEALGDLRYDIIVSNPPYVSMEEYKTLAKDITDYEPPLALLASEDGLAFYKAISKTAPAHLKEGGKLLLEVGAKQSKRVARMLEESFTNIRVLKDLAGRERVVCAEKKS